MKQKPPDDTPGRIREPGNRGPSYFGDDDKVHRLPAPGDPGYRDPSKTPHLEAAPDGWQERLARQRMVWGIHDLYEPGEPSHLHDTAPEENREKANEVIPEKK